MRWASVLLGLLCACQTPRSQGWQDTPTEAREVRIIVVVLNLGGTVTLDRAGSLDQSGAVGAGGATETAASQRTDVDAAADVRVVP